jgi:hypothetical protein
MALYLKGSSQGVITVRTSNPDYYQNTLLATCFHAGFFLDPEDEGDMFH